MRNSTLFTLQSLVLSMGLAATALVNASCGASYCLLNTSWDTQGVPTTPGKFRLDVHYELINQDQLRRGTHNISAAEDNDEEALEQSTHNQNITSMLDYTFNSHWGVALTLPWVKREHQHVAEPFAAAESEQWHFSSLADARIVSRYQFEHAATEAAWGLQLGMKFATGKINQTNAEGVVAERALQPSTGSHDVIVGAFYMHHLPMENVSYFAQLQYQHSVSVEDNFRPGQQTTLSAGITYPANQKLSVMLQFNAEQKQHDSGSNAEPDLSGGRYAYLSPGIAYAVTRDSKLYGFWQQPIYRNVNGIQLSAKEAFVVGVSVGF